MIVRLDRGLTMSEQDEMLPPQMLLVLQIIAGALLFGVILFLTVAATIVFFHGNAGGIAPAGQMPLLTIVAVVFFVVDGPFAFLIPGIQTRNALNKLAASPSGSKFASLLPLRQSTLITSLAILEGAAFLGCIAYLVEGQYYALLPVAAAILLILVQFPTEYRVRSWLNRQCDQLAKLRLQNDALES